MNKQEFLSDLEIFGSLEGMQEVKEVKPYEYTFYKSHLFPNFKTECKVKVFKRESKRGAISYHHVMQYVDIDKGLVKLPRSSKVYLPGSLLDSIITTSRYIIA